MYLVIDGLWEDFSRHTKAERIPTHSGGLSGSRIFLKIISVTKSSSLVLISHATLPFNVISPVIAISLLILISVRDEINEVNIVIPALGPSLGIAPSGTCK